MESTYVSESFSLLKALFIFTSWAKKCWKGSYYQTFATILFPKYLLLVKLGY